MASLANYVYIIAGALFILSLKWLSHPKTARRGVLAGEIGMGLAVVGTLLIFETRLCGSFRLPNTIASVGHACWHAVWMSPSRISRSSTFASMRAWLIRCTQ